MAILATIKRRLNEVAKELSYELADGYKVTLKMFITSVEGKTEQSIGVVILEYDTWVVNSIEISIDPDASLIDTLNHVKNRFRTTSKFDQYRKSRTYTIKELIKKLEDEDDQNQKIWFCRKESCVCMLMHNGCLKSYRLNGKAEYNEEEYNEIRKNLLQSAPIAFSITVFYEEFKDYIRKFRPEISIYEHDFDNDPMDEGDDFHFKVDKGIGVLSELDVKSFTTLYEFLNWFEIRKEMKK